jgi:hypothetical protein
MDAAMDARHRPDYPTRTDADGLTLDAGKAFKPASEKATPCSDCIGVRQTSDPYRSALLPSSTCLPLPSGSL